MAKNYTNKYRFPLQQTTLSHITILTYVTASQACWDIYCSYLKQREYKTAKVKVTNKIKLAKFVSLDNFNWRQASQLRGLSMNWKSSLTRLYQSWMYPLASSCYSTSSCLDSLTLLAGNWGPVVRWKLCKRPWTEPDSWWHMMIHAGLQL